MNITNTPQEQLMQENPVFQQLVQEHRNYESRLGELSALAYPNDNEQLEETTLKKKKLMIKDQMYEMMLDHQKH